jgi:hypothetical protein
MLASGIIYDVIFVPPSSGQFVDGSGKARVLSMRLGRQNIGKQYIIEGLSAGFLVVAKFPLLPSEAELKDCSFDFF